jgi:beta-glucosidase
VASTGSVAINIGASDRAAVLHVNGMQLRYWDAKAKRYVVEPGAYEFQIGSSSADIRARQIITVTVN